MAPTSLLVLVPFDSHFHRLRRRGLGSSHHQTDQSSALRNEHPKPRAENTTSRPTLVLEGPSPSSIHPMPSASIVLGSEPSAIQTSNNQPGDVAGNIVAAVVVVVLILGGLIGLAVGGEMLRREVKIRGERASPPPSRRDGHRKSKPTKNTARSPQQPIKINHEKFPYDEKTLTSPTRPPPVLNKDRRRGLSNVWPIRGLSRALSNRRSCPEQAEPSPRRSSLAACPHTTWSEFSPATLYVPPQRTVLGRIPEEREEEDSQSQINSNITAVLGVTLERSSWPDSAVPTKEQGPSHSMLLDGSHGPESLGQVSSQDCQITGDVDSKSLESSAPGMTSDEGESSRSSTASLGNFEDGTDGESLRNEAFELRRAQTRSMQMNKGVLLSFCLKTPDDGRNVESVHAELRCGSSESPSAAGAEGTNRPGKDEEVSLAMLGGGISAVSLDEFPSPPSMLPMIPSFVSGF